LKIQDGGGCRLGKSKNRHILATVSTISMKFVTVTQFHPLSVKFEVLKIQDGGGRHLGKSKNRNISAAV